MADQWAWWRAALAGTAETINVGLEPQAGFYRNRRRNNATCEVTYQPVAYWYDPAQWAEQGCAAQLLCKLDGRMIGFDWACDMWPFVSQHPFPKEVYDAVRRGACWPDQHEAAHYDRITWGTVIGDIELRVSELARAAQIMIRAGPAHSADECGRASDLADRLLKLEKLAKTRGLSQMREAAGTYKYQLKTFVIKPFKTATQNQ